MEAQVTKKKINPWSERTIITIPQKQFQKLLKKGKCKTVVNYQWYIIQKQPDIADIQLFDKDGKHISLTLLKKLLRKV